MQKLHKYKLELTYERAITHYTIFQNTAFFALSIHLPNEFLGHTLSIKTITTLEGTANVPQSTSKQFQSIVLHACSDSMQRESKNTHLH